MHLRSMAERWRSILCRRPPAQPEVDLPSCNREAPGIERARFEKGEGHETWDHFYPILIGASTIGARAGATESLRRVIGILRKLEEDSYIRYLLAYYQAGLLQAGEEWHYADITTALLASSTLLQPQSYLEIGVRRGRSMAVVASACPQVSIVGFDMWVGNYGDMPNPGPEFVRNELRKVGHTGTLELVSGDSHVTVPDYLAKHPEAYYDMITVDGDHSQSGASMDLRDVLPRLKVGGVVVFDDIASRDAPFLRDVWRRYVASQPRYAVWEYDELGFGIALGVRKY